MILILTCLSLCDFAYGQVVRDSIKIHFRTGDATLRPSLEDNEAALNRIADSLAVTYADSIYQLREILVIGSASPEGSIDLNKRLSEKRANVLFDYLSRYGELPESSKNFIYLGRNWKELLRLVQEDENVPYRDEVILLLEDIVTKCVDEELPSDNNIGRLMMLRDGVPYCYMYRTLFPELRTSQLILSYVRVANLNRLAAPKMQGVTIADSVSDFSSLELQPFIPDTVASYPFFMAIKSNMLYDAAMTPNIGVEFYLGHGFSLSANYQHAWWKNDKNAFYWRIYGGELEARYWFGKRAKARPLTGHHVGLYGQILTYDFCLGNDGILTPKTPWLIGASYGYSFPIHRVLNLDFGVGVGYHTGIYYEYIPLDGHYVWQATKRRHWFGPTKAEISLVWRINANIAKGGRK